MGGLHPESDSCILLTEHHQIEQKWMKEVNFSTRLSDSEILIHLLVHSTRCQIDIFICRQLVLGNCNGLPLATYKDWSSTQSEFRDLYHQPRDIIGLPY